jgi:hypothetical protein
MFKFIVNMFSSQIKIVFSGTEATAFVRNEKVPFLFSCADNDMKGSVKRLFEKLTEVRNTYLKGCLVRPILWFDVTAFSGDKESFKKEVIEPSNEKLLRFGCCFAGLIDGSKQSILLK